MLTTEERERVRKMTKRMDEINIIYMELLQEVDDIKNELDEIYKDLLTDEK